MLKFRLPWYCRPAASAKVALIWFCVPVSVMWLVLLLATPPAPSPPTTPLVLKLSVPWLTDRSTWMFWFAGSASTSLTDSPVIANSVSSFPEGFVPGSVFTGASSTASMVSVVD